MPTPNPIQHQTASGSSGTTASVTLASTPTPGNLLLAVLYVRSTAQASPGGSWTSVTSAAGVSPEPGSGSAPRLWVGYRVAGASESATITVGLNNSADWALTCWEVEAVDSSAPIDDFEQLGLATESFEAECEGATSGGDNLGMVIAATRGNSNASTIQIAAPSGYTTDADATYQDTNGRSLMSAYRATPFQDSVGGSFTLTVDDARNQTASVILRGTPATSTTLTPDPVAVTLTPVTPLLSGIALTLAPDPVTLTLTLPEPVVNAITLAPDPVGVALVVPAPGLALTLAPGAPGPAPTTLRPDPVVVTLALVDPALQFAVGGGSLAPDPVSVVLSAPDPALSLSVTPDPVALALTLPAPSVQTTGLFPDPVSIVLSAPEPAVSVAGGVSLTPLPVSVALSIPTPAVVGGAVSPGRYMTFKSLGGVFSIEA